MYNSSCSGLNGEIAVQYKLKDTKFTAVDYEYGIGSNLIGNFTFVSEIDVNNNDKGLFISGLLNTSPPEYPYDYLVLGTGIPQFPSLLFLLTENNDTLILGERIE